MAPSAMLTAARYRNAGRGQSDPCHARGPRLSAAAAVGSSPSRAGVQAVVPQAATTANAAAVATSMIGYRAEIRTPQQRARPPSRSQETTGMLSRGAIGAPQRGQRLPGRTTDWPSGTRAMTTLRKLPTMSPTAAQTATVTTTSTVSARRRAPDADTAAGRNVAAATSRVAAATSWCWLGPRSRVALRPQASRSLGQKSVPAVQVPFWSPFCAEYFQIGADDPF